MKHSRRDLLELGLTLKEAQACIILSYNHPYHTGYDHEMRYTPKGHVYSAVVVNLDKLQEYASNRPIHQHVAKAMKAVNNTAAKAYSLYKQKDTK